MCGINLPCINKAIFINTIKKCRLYNFFLILKIMKEGREKKGEKVLNVYLIVVLGCKKMHKSASSLVLRELPE